MNESAVQIKVPNDVIRSVVMAEIMKQIGDPSEVFGAIVAHYLGEPVDRGPYDREKVPRWEKLFMGRLKEVAQECTSALVDEMRPADPGGAQEEAHVQSDRRRAREGAGSVGVFLELVGQAGATA